MLKKRDVKSQRKGLQSGGLKHSSLILNTEKKFQRKKSTEKPTKSKANWTATDASAPELARPTGMWSMNVKRTRQSSLNAFVSSCQRLRCSDQSSNGAIIESNKEEKKTHELWYVFWILILH